MNNSHDSKRSKAPRYKPYVIAFCLIVLGICYFQIGKTTVPASPLAIAELKAAARVDMRPAVAKKLEKKLAKTPEPKVWELNYMKKQLGLDYIDKEKQKDAKKD